MKLSDAILAIIQANGGGIEGRTTMQKLLYFVAVKTDQSLLREFRPHYYGPYSPSAAGVLDRLIGLNFVKEGARYTSRDHLIYSYALTPDGEAIAKGFTSTQPDLFGTIGWIVRMANKVAGLNPDILAFAAKAHYIIASKQKPGTMGEIAQEGRKFGWELSEKEAGRGARLLLALRLAQKG